MATASVRDDAGGLFVQGNTMCEGGGFASRFHDLLSDGEGDGLGAVDDAQLREE